MLQEEVWGEAVGVWGKEGISEKRGCNPQNTLVDLVHQFYLNRGTHLFLDEMHRYPDWAIEIKNLYDSYPDLHIVFTGSSILEIYKAQADARTDYPREGDFMIDNTYIFEVGGKGKAFKQIRNLPNSYVAYDDMEIGLGCSCIKWNFPQIS